MAQVNTLEVPQEIAEAFARVMSAVSGRGTGAIRSHGKVLSRARKQKLSRQSLLAEVAARKKTLSGSDIAAWREMATASGQKWYSLFSQDTCYRIKNGLDGVATPSPFRAYKVGKIEVTDSNARVLLRQEHPSHYWISQKLGGKTTQRVDVRIHEKFHLPLTVGLSYKSNLTKHGSEAKIRLYGVIYSSYQGRTLENVLEVDLLPTTEWRRVEESLVDVIGIPSHYDLFLELDKVTGTFAFDNVKAFHSLTNYARAPRCNNILKKPGAKDLQLAPAWEVIRTGHNVKITTEYHENA